jgi:hypothetical protein
MVNDNLKGSGNGFGVKITPHIVPLVVLYELECGELVL